MKKGRQMVKTLKRGNKYECISFRKNIFTIVYCCLANMTAWKMYNLKKKHENHSRVMDLLQVHPHWEPRCILQTRNGSTHSLVHSRGGHQIGNTTTARVIHAAFMNANLCVSPSRRTSGVPRQSYHLQYAVLYATQPL